MCVLSTRKIWVQSLIKLLHSQRASSLAFRRGTPDIQQKKNKLKKFFIANFSQGYIRIHVDYLTVLPRYKLFWEAEKQRKRERFNFLTLV